MSETLPAIKTITNAEEHQEALDRVDELSDAKPGTPEGEELDDLIDIIEAYEDIHYPMGFQKEAVDQASIAAA